MMRRVFKLLNFLFPVLLMLTASVAFVYIAKDKTSALNFQHLLDSLFNNLHFALIAILLLFPNWLIETFKWKSLVQKYVPLNYTQSLKSIFAGIGLSIFTPNRIGDFGGRVLYVKKEERWVTFYMTFICSCSQLLITIIIGSVGLIYFFKSIPFNLLSDWPLLYVFCTIILDLIFILLYLNLEKFRRLYSFLLQKLDLKVESFPIVPKKQKLKILLLSLLRYQIFALQFHLLMMLIGSEMGFIPSYLALSMVYLFTSFLPTSIISEIPVRGTIAYFVFSLLNLDAELAVFSFVLMWFINLMIPAIFSLYLLKDVKLPKFLKAKFA